MADFGDLLDQQYNSDLGLITDANGNLTEDPAVTQPDPVQQEVNTQSSGGGFLNFVNGLSGAIKNFKTPTVNTNVSISSSSKKFVMLAVGALALLFITQKRR